MLSQVAELKSVFSFHPCKGVRAKRQLCDSASDLCFIVLQTSISTTVVRKSTPSPGPIHWGHVLGALSG